MWALVPARGQVAQACREAGAPQVEQVIADLTQRADTNKVAEVRPRCCLCRIKGPRPCLEALRGVLPPRLCMPGTCSPAQSARMCSKPGTVSAMV